MTGIKRINLRAIAFVSALIALVLSINLLVGAQELKRGGDHTPPGSQQIKKEPRITLLLTNNS